jgi:hypothetical protein
MNRRVFGAFAAALVIACAGVRSGTTHAQATAPVLSFPVACQIGATCFVQNYFDHDRGAGAKDYRCGALTYDGHDGTDIRLANLVAMRKGVAVLAAADGVVRAVRDGMADVSIRETGAAAVKGREAGNGVVVDHGGGWQTQYSHLRKDSVQVKRGDRVTAGQALGLIGLSGRTEFPHLHFTVRRDSKPLDPFVGAGEYAGCRGETTALWRPTLAAALGYVPAGLLNAGFAGAPPTFEDVKRGEPTPPDRSSPALVFWIDAYGLVAGDVEHLRITGPDGAAIAELRRTAPSNKAEWFVYTGKKRTADAWPKGVYRGEYTLTRNTPTGPLRVISAVRELSFAP